MRMRINKKMEKLNSIFRKTILGSENCKDICGLTWEKDSVLIFYPHFFDSFLLIALHFEE